LTCSAVLSLSGQAQNKPDWQKHLDWSIQNSDAGGSVDCPDKICRNLSRVLGFGWTLVHDEKSDPIG
jgi:hypothetical protein